MADVTLRIDVIGDSKGAQIIRAELERLTPSLQTVVDRAKQAGDVASKSMGEAAKAAQGAGVNIQDLAKQADAFIAKVPGLAGLKTPFAEATKTIQGTVGDLGEVAKAIGPVGIAAGIAAVAVVGMGAALLTMGKEAHANYATIANRTGLTGQSLERLNGQFRTLASTSAASGSEVASALGQVVSATGRSDDGVVSLTKQLMNMSRVTGTDLGSNIGLTTRMFGDWNVSTDKQSGALDALFRASQSSGRGVDELSRLVVQFGAPLRNFGFSMNEGIAMLAKWQKEGVNTELVMGSLRIASGKFAKEGVDLREGLKGAITEIKNAGSASEATGIAMKIFGARAGADMADAIRGGKFEYADMLKVVSSGDSTISGAADNAAGMSGAFAKMGNAAQQNLAPLADAVYDIASKIVMQAVPAVTAFWMTIGNRLVPIAKTAKEVLIPLIEKIGPVLEHAVNGAMAAISRHSGAIMGALKALGMLAIAVGVAAVAMNLGTIAAGAMAIATGILGGAVALLTSPVTLVIAAVVLLGAAWGENWGGIREKTASAVAAVKGFVDDLGKNWQAFTASIGQSGSDLQQSIEGTWSSIQQSVSGAASGLWDSVSALWANGKVKLDGLGQALSDKIAETWATIGDNVSQAATDLWQWLTSAFTNGVGYLLSLGQMLALGLQAAWSWIVTTVSGLAASIINWLQQKWAALNVMLGGILTRLGLMFQTAWNWIVDTVGGLARGLVNWLSQIFHRGGQIVAEVMDKLSDVFQTAWNGIIGFFKQAGQSILDGIGSVFTGVATIVKNGMLAAGGIVQKVMDAIAKKIADLAVALGPIGGAIAGIGASLQAGARNFMDGIGSQVDGLIHGIASGAGKIGDAFGATITAARQRVSSFFAGSAEDVDNEASRAAGRAGGGPPELGLTGGGGADISGIGAPGGGRGPKADAQLGGSGHDSMGDFYYDPETGAKVYTSGVGKARADAKAAERAAKAAKKAAKKPPKDAPGEDEAKVAVTIANTAEKVTAAIQAGLDAVSSLSEADIPGRDKWEPKLNLVAEFVSTALAKFDELGAGLLGSVGKLKDGESIMDTVKARSITGVTVMSQSVLDTVSKAGGFLSSLRTTKMPTQAQIDTAFGLIGDLLTRIRNKGIELADSPAFAGGDAEHDPAAKFAAVASAMGAWSDGFLKLVDGAVKMGASAKTIGQAGSTLPAVENLMHEVARIGGEMVAGLQKAIPEDQQQEALRLSRDIAATFDAWFGVIGRLGAAAKAIGETAKIPSDIGPKIERFMLEIGRIGGQFVAGIMKAYQTATERGDALSLSRDVATTFEAWFRVTETLGKAARSIRDISRIPEGIGAGIERFMAEIGRIGNVFVSGLSRSVPDHDEQLAALGVSVAVANTFGSWFDVLAKLASSAKSIAKIPEIPKSATERVQSILQRAADILYVFAGPLLKDAEKAQADLGTAGLVAQALGTAVDLVTKAASSLGAISKAKPIDSGAVDRVLANVRLLLQRVSAEAKRWAGDADPDDIASDASRLKAWGEQARMAVSAVGDFAAMVVKNIKPVDARAIDLVLDNLGMVLAAVVARANVWAARLDPDAAAADAAQLGSWSGMAKTSLDLVSGFAALVLKDIKIVDPRAIDRLLISVDIVLARVMSWSSTWAKRMDADDIAEKTGVMDAWTKAAKAALDLVTSFAGFALKDIRVVDARAVDRVLVSVDIVLARVISWAKSWAKFLDADAMAATASLLDTWTKAAKSAVDVVAGAAGLVLDGVKVVDPAAVDRVLANVALVLAKVKAAAEKWADGLNPDEQLAQAAKIDAWTKAGNVSVDTIGKVFDLFNTIAEHVTPKGAKTDIAADLRRLTQTAGDILRELAGLFDVLVQEGGDRLEKATKIAPVISSAADAVAKVLDALSLDKLLNSPLVDTKLRSGFMTKVASRRLDALKDQIVAGIRRTVDALILGLKDITVPANLGDGLDRVAAIYERIAAVLERISALKTPSTKQIAEIARATRDLIAAVGTQTPAPAGVGGASATGSTTVPTGTISNLGSPRMGGGARKTGDGSVTIVIQNKVDDQVVSTTTKTTRHQQTHKRWRRQVPGAI